LLLLSATAYAQYANFSSQDEQEIVRLVNSERQSLGLATLVVDERLQEAARKHSVRMAATGEVEHRIGNEPVLSLRLGETALRFNVSGENVALAQDAARAHTALMHSPGHRANILDAQYNSIGVGVVRTPQGIYVTQDFARRLPEVSVQEAEEQVGLTLNRLRRKAGTPVLSRVPAPQLRQEACEMAENNKLNARAGLTPKVSNSVVFTATDLTQLPGSLERLKTRPASGFSVGACYETSKSYDTPVFWIVVVTYF
jgi:Cysteine-rich secretory protein family